MISERDVYATANLMVKRYGDDAATEAAQRADKLLAEGDVAGAAVWRRVVAAVEDMQRARPRDGEAVH